MSAGRHTRTTARADAVDWLVVTAANAAQARGYRAQLAARAKDGRLAGVTRWMVVADSGGKRIGSGASTILVLWKLADKLASGKTGGRSKRVSADSLASLFAGKRIIVLHSGGDSRRLPAYAAQGKIFAPLPPTHAGGLSRELFDEVLEDIAALRTPAEGRVIVAAGDLLLNASCSDPDLSAPGIVGVASAESLSRASRHGVFVFGKKASGIGHRASGGGPVDAGELVARFLQKPSAARMREAGAVVGGKAWVDTGIVSFDPASAARVLEAAGIKLEHGHVVARSAFAEAVRIGSCPQIDLYVHVLAALPEATTREQYLAELTSVFGPLNEAMLWASDTIYDGLRGTRFSAAKLESCSFLHIGSTRELLDLHRVASRAAMVDGGTLGTRSKLGGRNLVVGLPAGLKNLRLPRGIGLTALPVGRADWAVIAFGESDDCKTPMERGGTGLSRGLDTLGDPATIWKPGSPRTFWDARLWKAGTIAASLETALAYVNGTGSPPAHALSLAELLPRVNHARLIAHRDQWRRTRVSSELLRRLDADPDLGAAEVAASLTDAAECTRAVRQIARTLSPSRSTLRDARLLRVAAVIGEQSPTAVKALRSRVGSDLNDAACDAVARAVLSEQELPDEPGRSRMKVGGVVRAECPVRVDLAGGWSDTPPVCHERGGSVVNTSIVLNGERPLRAAATLLARPVIVLRSVDLGGRLELRSTTEVFDHQRDGDWSALAKAACVLAGIAPPDARIGLKSWLERFGGGVELVFESAVPKGSGLGTSSALGATMLAALDGIAGRRGSVRSMLGRATLLEQMMGTGGGWQDQSGAALGGTRILRTRPGMDQLPKAERLPFEIGAGTAFEGRVLLYYTGMQRLAKGILRQIVLRYLARDRHTLGIIERLKAGAERAAAALKEHEDDAFCRAVEEYWWLKRSIDPGASNAKIEAIVDRVRDLLSACVMPGAGGGGFLFMIARDSDAAALARKRLEVEPPNGRARFYALGVDPAGLRVGN